MAKWRAVTCYKAIWDQQNMRGTGVKEVVKLISEDGREIETTEEKLDAALDSMAERTLYTQEHQERTQAIFRKWMNVSDVNSNMWPEIAQDIKALIDWLFENRDKFPNHLAHHSSWSELHKLANMRSYTREFIQKCTGNPHECHDLADCFNLQHMMSEYIFESACASDGLCKVTMKDRRYFQQ
jgi:hypothetical protein